jgi:outer membrane protein
MKKGKIILLGSLLTFPPLLWAKTGVLDVQRVILSVPEGKEARAKLEKLAKEKEENIKKQRAELKKKDQELQQGAQEFQKMDQELQQLGKSTLLSEEAKEKKVAALQKKQQELQEKQRDLHQKAKESNDAEEEFRASLKHEEIQATQKIAITASHIASEMGKKEDFDFVFEAGSSGLIYAKDPIDLTERVIQQYKPEALKPPVAGPGAASKATPVTGPGAGG